MSRSWMTGGGRVKSRSGVVSSHLVVPLRAVAPTRPSRRHRIRLWFQLVGSIVTEWRARRRIRRAR